MGETIGPSARLKRSHASLNPSRIGYSGSCVSHREELSAQVVHSGHNQRPVQEIVVLLTRRLGDKQATVASSAKQKATFVCVLRLCVGAERVIRTDCPALQCLHCAV